MSTQMRAIVDKLLTNVSNQLVPQGYISEMVLPELSVVQTSGLIGKYSNDHLRIIDTKVGGKGLYPMVDTTVRSSTSYNLVDHALKELLVANDYDNVEKPFDAEQDAVVSLTTHLWLEKEKGLADTMAGATITQGVTLAGANQWSAYTTSNPLSDLRDGRKGVRAGCGQKANIAFMDEDVADTLRFHPQLLDSLGFKDNRPGGLIDAELAKALKVDKVYVAEVVYNSSLQPSADSLAPVWGKHFWYAASPATAARRQQALGYRLQKAGEKPRQVFKSYPDEPVNSTKIIVKDQYQQVITNAACAYRITNASA
jgi:hypothetical protein